MERYMGISTEIDLRQGWNWVAYPYEYDYPLADIFDASKLAEGSTILAKKGGFANVVSGAWQGTLETLTAGEGYMLQSGSEVEAYSMPDRTDLPQGTWAEETSTANTLAARNARGSRLATVWEYDTRRFANTMAILGKLDVEYPEDYTIGVFVGDECRGEGKIVNGMAYITAGGESGETLTFKLYNTFNGEYSTVDTELAFGAMAGTMQQPVVLAGISGIDEVNMGGESIYFSGDVLNLGNYNGTAMLTTIDGKILAKTTEKTISVDGLSAGVYVVVVESDNGRLVKKITKM
jgi:hypothetical protein